MRTILSNRLITPGSGRIIRVTGGIVLFGGDEASGSRWLSPVRQRQQRRLEDLHESTRQLIGRELVISP